MKIRIVERTEGIFTIEQFKSLEEFGRKGFWSKVVSYDINGLNELNYYYSLEDAKKAVEKYIDRIKNPHKEDDYTRAEYEI